MTDKIIIGVAGRIASGKGTISKYLIDEHKADRFRSSDPLRETMDVFDVDQSRDNMDALSTFLRSTYGENVIAKSVANRIEESPNPISIFDGIRRLIDVETFRKLPHFYLLFMDTDVRLRYERYIKRDENPGDAELTYEEFLERDNREPQQQIELLRDHADYVLNNNGSISELDARIREVITELMAKQKAS
ncbi:hypothetical protein HY620_02725 [Candidatus Uhrbacteria bacterium]|nr:hypothetical protein [Candidatus Uhrbacteria bacterium]